MTYDTTRTTLEQQRAQNAWQVCARYQDEHVKAAKGLPALIMNSGLLQVLAFCHQKSDSAPGLIGSDLRAWLASRYPATFPHGSDFTSFMQALIAADSQTCQAIHAEAFAWLKWLRQLSAARIEEN